MKICVPTQEDKGINSTAYSHFGSAPYFIVYDTEKKEIKTISNANQHHDHGKCNPMHALGSESIGAVLVGGIGKRAIDGLNSMGIKVYQSIEGTVETNIQALENKLLQELTPQNACAGHGNGVGCGH